MGNLNYSKTWLKDTLENFTQTLSAWHIVIQKRNLIYEYIGMFIYLSIYDEPCSTRHCKGQKLGVSILPCKIEILLHACYFLADFNIYVYALLNV